MKIIYLDNETKIDDEITLSIGNFDGLHLGHRKLLETVKMYTDSKHAVLTLEPHPRKLFSSSEFKTIFTISGKIKLFEKEGFDYLLIANFDEAFASMSVNEFISFLKHLNVKRLVLGSDFRFANKASGSLQELKENFEVVEIKTIKSNDENRISTTLIKTLIQAGKITLANKYLGYNYHLYGTVEHGNKVGRTLGFPTANIKYEDVILPKNGVYFVQITIDNINYNALASIGNNPTINSSSKRKVEVYILDFSNNIYDKEVVITFYEEIRAEIKFDNVNDLINMMYEDENIARNLIKKYNLW